MALLALQVAHSFGLRCVALRWKPESCQKEWNQGKRRGKESILISWTRCVQTWNGHHKNRMPSSQLTQNFTKDIASNGTEERFVTIFRKIVHLKKNALIFLHFFGHNFWRLRTVPVMKNKNLIRLQTIGKRLSKTIPRRFRVLI